MEQQPITAVVTVTHKNSDLIQATLPSPLLLQHKGPYRTGEYRPAGVPVRSAESPPDEADLPGPPPIPLRLARYALSAMHPRLGGYGGAPTPRQVGGLRLRLRAHGGSYAPPPTPLYCSIVSQTGLGLTAIAGVERQVQVRMARAVRPAGGPSPCPSSLISPAPPLTVSSPPLHSPSALLRLSVTCPPALLSRRCAPSVFVPRGAGLRASAAR
eukprot:132476-Rhodomonas_salina.1